MSNTGIYKISSKLKEDRVYIGSAVNISRRWYLHRSQLRNNKHHNIKLQRHFNKYGEEDLVFSIVEICEKANLIENEQKYIDLFNSYFNIARRAGSTLGVKGKKHTKEFKEYLRNRNLGNTYWRGRKHTEEEKRKISEGNRGKTLSKETRIKISNSRRGKFYKGAPCSEEKKRKISMANKGKTAWNKGRKSSQETRNKIKDSWIIRKKEMVQRRNLMIVHP